PCCLPALGGFGGMTPHEGSASQSTGLRPRHVMRRIRLTGCSSGRYAPCSTSVVPKSLSSPAEDSPSGLGRTLGKRVGGNPSRVRISYPPPVPHRARCRRAPPFAVGPFVVCGRRARPPQHVRAPATIEALSAGSRTAV